MFSKHAARVIAAHRVGYHVTTSGDALSPFGKQLATSLSGGYLKFSISRDFGPGRTVLVHKLAAYQWFGLRALEEGTQVRHLNGDKTDNRRRNLDVGTASQNQMDIPGHQRMERSMKAASAAASKNRRFSNDEVRTIRQSDISTKRLARELGASASTISAIRNRRTYKDLP